jgi:hypothetical protein
MNLFAIGVEKKFIDIKPVTGFRRIRAMGPISVQRVRA